VAYGRGAYRATSLEYCIVVKVLFEGLVEVEIGEEARNYEMKN